MGYVPRNIENAVKRIARSFASVLVTGPRQTGKTTLLKKLFLNEAKFVTFDNKQDLLMARQSEELFFKQNKPPVILDEIQYAPNLFSEIKLISDRDRKKGQFYMTGSQAYELMQNVSESLAGRVGIVRMLGLSFRETAQDGCLTPFIPTEEFLESRKTDKDSDEYWCVWNRIVRGGYPELHENQEIQTMDYYSSYVATYLERDVRQLIHISDELDFIRFMTVTAAHTGRLVNYDSIARDVGVSPQTVKRWMSILITSGLVYLLEPYHNNLISRAVKTPKLYFMDTGLVCHLTRWYAPEQAERGAMSGALFETFVVSEIIKGYYNAGNPKPPLYFYRDKDGKEIDLIIHENGTLYPIEIKKRGAAALGDIAVFKALDGNPQCERGTGAVIALADEMRYLDARNRVVPVRMI